MNSNLPFSGKCSYFTSLSFKSVRIGLYIFFMCFFFVLATIAKSLACRLLNGAKVVRLVHFSDRKLYYYATVVALSPAIYVGMQSVGGAGVFEIVLLFVFEILACFFVHKKY